MQSQSELLNNLINTLELLDADDPATQGFGAYFHEFDNRIPDFVSELVEHVKFNGSDQFAGSKMEQIAFLIFCRLKGLSETKSFQSPGPQYDLLVAGDGAYWVSLCRWLRIADGASILVEAKAVESKVDDQGFARLCALMEQNLPHAGLGVFVTLNGATGFPTPKQRQRCFVACRLRQVLFFARTGKPIIVLDQGDLETLTASADFMLTIRRKIRDISSLSGLPVPKANTLVDVDLPSHLSELKDE